MGLSGPRNRRKLDYDPNNTKWTRDETTFGQKILRAQGWEPGKFLGAQDASHAQLHSAASLAPIKINMKDDTVGLGAKIRQKQSDECTGLDVFKDLLGRLNGKSEETLEKERQARFETKTNLYIERKYGPMRFVSGGLLVGDQMKMEELMDKKPASPPVKDEATSETSEAKSTRKDRKGKKDKKRKTRESEENDSSESKREKKRKRSKAEAGLGNDDSEVEKSTKKKKESKEKRSKRSVKALEEEGEQVELVESKARRTRSKKSKDALNQDPPSDVSTDIPEDAAEDKSEKEKKKDKKRKRSANPEEASEVNATTASSTTTLTSTPQDSGSSTPRSTHASTIQTLSARHRARSRNIASKKLAFGDMQALNQIFMIKPV
ncbi:hypothetical protein GGS21DRAFT_61377 [Xylaria nigripes]|nr:hypothetical protein GGS21DRAFT_61377 [Xylaria nigripes]